MPAQSKALAVLLALSCWAMASVALCETSDKRALREFYDLKEGKRLYGQYCEFCHGEQGKGKAYNLVSPPPPDLTAQAVQRKSDADLAKVIHEGEKGTAMGAWKWTLLEKEKQNVLLYLRQLAR